MASTIKPLLLLLIKKAKSLMKLKFKRFRLKLSHHQGIDFFVENVWISILSNF